MNIWPGSIHLRFTCELHSKRGGPFVSWRTRLWNLGVVSKQFANRVAFPSVGGSWLVRRVVWCVVDRAWSSLNLPIELQSDPLLLSLSFSLSRYILSSLSLRPSRSADLFLPYFPHRSRTLLPVLSTSHPSFALHIGHGNEVTSRCPFDRFIETATHSAYHLHELFFIASNADCQPRVNKWINRDYTI